MKVKFKKLQTEAKIPQYAKPGDAGMDLYATSLGWDNDTQCWVYGTDLAMEIPEGYVGLIFPRSSICKYALSLSNSVGVVDSGYRGEVKFFFKELEFDTKNMYKPGDRIGQLVIMPFPTIEPEEVSELSTTERGTGGFGSSGK